MPIGVINQAWLSLLGFYQGEHCHFKVREHRVAYFFLHFSFTWIFQQLCVYTKLKFVFEKKTLPSSFLMRIAGLMNFRWWKTMAQFLNAENCLHVLLPHLLLAMPLTSLIWQTHLYFLPKRAMVSRDSLNYTWLSPSQPLQVTFSMLPVQRNP